MPKSPSSKLIAHSPKSIRIAVSRCLLGDEVRYDAQQQRDHFIADTLGPHFDWLPICPEVEIGLGVPRPKIRLERSAADAEVRLVMPSTGRDLTAKMTAHSRRLVRQIQSEGVAGCLLKSRSPSCGLSRVKTFTQGGRMRRVGVGFFAKTITEMMPDLPVEEDDRMHNPAVRDNWVERVFAYRRLDHLFTGGCKTVDLVAFHETHRLVLMSHFRAAYDELGRILQEFPAKSSSRVPAALAKQYRGRFMAVLCRPTTRSKNAAVLRLILTSLEAGLDSKTRLRLAALIDDYRQGDDGVPLVVPRTLLAHFADVLQVAEFCTQVYLHPDSAELGLRNHA